MKFLDTKENKVIELSESSEAETESEEEEQEEGEEEDSSGEEEEEDAEPPGDRCRSCGRNCICNGTPSYSDEEGGKLVSQALSKTMPSASKRRKSQAGKKSPVKRRKTGSAASKKKKPSKAKASRKPKPAGRPFTAKQKEAIKKQLESIHRSLL